MLVKEYREIVKISEMELNTVWDKIGEKSLLIGGWAAYFLVNDSFREWKNVDYIGSKDIDLGIRASDLDFMIKTLIDIEYKPLNFRFYKIFDRETGKELSVNESKNIPLHNLFYLYIDLILDEKIEKNILFFSDPIIKLCLDYDLWIRIKKFKVIRPEPLLLIKMRILDQRDPEKRMKDILDSIFISSFSDFDNNLFKELIEIFPIKKENTDLAKKILNSKTFILELTDLGIEKDEISNLVAAFLILTEPKRT